MSIAQAQPFAWMMVVASFAAGALVASAVIAIATRRGWRGPVEALTRLAADLAAGRWDRRSAAMPAATFEARRLADQFDRVADAAEVRFAQLNERAANLKLLVDALPDPILVSDAHDRIVLINAPAERLLQLPPREVIGRPFVAAVNDLAILELFEACAARRRGEGDVARAAKPIARELRLLRRGQRLLFQGHAEPTSRGGTLIVLRDVSSLAAAIQMKTDFVANASHELRTPISAIKAAFETLREVYHDADERPVADRCVSIIDGHLGRLEEMLRDLLDLSRVESADLKPVFGPVRAPELAAALRSMLAPFAAERGVELSLPEDEGDGEGAMTFQSDRRLLDLVLKNLVENALKFTPAGGRVTLTVDPAVGGAVRLTVADTGCGIPPEHAERVFERFYQVDTARTGGAARRGTGLGLAIVKHAVLALGGRIDLQSEPGVGTTITIVLPQAAS